MQETMKSAKMGSMPIAKLLFSMSLPAILSMFVQALYNIVDSIFIGQYDPFAALTAVNVAMPFQMLATAFALGVGVGTNVVVSRSLGEGNREKASRCAQTGVLMALVCFVAFIFVGVFLSGVYARAFSEGNGAVETLTTQYLQIVVGVSLFMFVEITLSKILQATGNMLVPMISQLLGAIVNIILDPFFINGYGFFPELGIVGAAVATVIGQGCAMVFVVCVFLLRRQDVSLRFQGFRLLWRNVRDILVVGIPTAVLNGLLSVTTILMYAILGDLTAKTVLGLYFKVQSFVFMPVYGLNQGAMPIMSYNYGRGDTKRFYGTYRLSVLVAAVILSVGTVVFLSAPSFLLGLFNVSDEATMQMGTLAFRVICIGFLPAAFDIINITMLQATQNGLYAMIVAVARQLVFLVPIAFAIKLLFKDAFLGYVWLCYPVSEVLALAVSFPLALTRAKRSFQRKSDPKTDILEKPSSEEK